MPYQHLVDSKQRQCDIFPFITIVITHVYTIGIKKTKKNKRSEALTWLPPNTATSRLFQRAALAAGAARLADVSAPVTNGKR